MASLTADAHVPHFGSPTCVDIPCTAADTFYAGAIVFADDDNGKAQVGSLNAADNFLGICARQTVTAAADELVPVFVDGVHGFKISGTTAADIGHIAVMDSSAITDNPDDLVAAADITEAANDTLLGTIVTVIGSYAYVNIGISFPKFATHAATDEVYHVPSGM